NPTGCISSVAVTATSWAWVFGGGTAVAPGMSWRVSSVSSFVLGINLADKKSLIGNTLVNAVTSLSAPGVTLLADSPSVPSLLIWASRWPSPNAGAGALMYRTLL